MKLAFSGMLALLVVGCPGPQLTTQDQKDLTAHADGLAKCREEGKAVAMDAGNDAGTAAYEACKKDGGLQ